MGNFDQFRDQANSSARRDASIWGEDCSTIYPANTISNLVGNAIKFTPPGGTIFVEAIANGQEARFSVRDTGQGISEVELPRIFDRFWQAQSNNHAGIGLGLSIVKGLVEAHGGRPWVESKLGAGTTFFFSLPLGKPVSDEVKTVAPPPQ